MQTSLTSCLGSALRSRTPFASKNAPRQTAHKVVRVDSSTFLWSCGSFAYSFSLIYKNAVRGYPRTAFGKGFVWFLLICPPAPPEKGKQSGVGFAPLHWPLGHPVFFMTGPRITKYHYLEVPEAAYSIFKVRPAAAPAPFRSWAAAVTIVYRTFEQKFMDS